jgi:hypothetical protein
LIRLSTAHKFAFAGFALLYLAIMLRSTGQLQAQEPAVVLLDPQTLSLNQGQKSSVVVRIEGATNVYGVQIELSFDAGKIKVLDTDGAKPGVQLLSGDFLTLDEGFVAVNEANNETGHLTYAATLLDPAEPASGTGILVEFELEALDTGRIDLLIDTIILASPEGAQLPVQLTQDPKDDNGINEPKAAATATASPAAPATEALLVTATPTVENVLTPSSTAESANGAAAASPVVENTRPPTSPETATLAASGDLATSTVPVQAPVEEPAPTRIKPSSIETPRVDRATEIAAVAPPEEKEDSNQAAELPSPALTVIGQNQNLDDFQAQSSTPAPTATNESIREGPAVAIGLILLIVALIAIWFMRRYLSRS